MIDKVVKLANGLDYYVLDELIVNKKIYLFLIQVDNLNNIVLDKCVVCEAETSNLGINIRNIYDEEEQEKINDMFIDRMHNRQINKN